MALKDKVLEILEENRGRSVSGNKMAESLGMTRSAIWKAVMQLRDEGYTITAVTNRGYCLTSENDLLNEPAVKSRLNTVEFGRKMDVFKSIDSTNTFAKKLAEIGTANGHTIIAEQQTEGRGRQGRRFHSPGNQGIYMSVIVRPDFELKPSSNLTACAAVAVAEAIENVTGLDCGIKWVNDIYINGKKVCGILTEASINVEQGYLDYAVIGVGINVNNGVFPKEIEDKATSLRLEKGEAVNRSELCAEMLYRLEQRINHLTDGDFMDEYRKRSILTGKIIDIDTGDSVERFSCKGIDDSGRLIVVGSDKKERRLTNGTVIMK
ncbi:MAG: biotin--[acetyl-CoA-carboxylase] ligase [Oscillospiraceae bacterium]|nr:biotin--[acetyl-CoA-carboxylase] ligase [Oscillospiraceae bacterium]